MKYKFPKPLERGDLVALVTPAGPVESTDLVSAAKLLESRGLVVQMRNDIAAKDRYMAGSDARRCQEVGRAIRDPEVKGIFLARGGYGTQRIIPDLGLSKELAPKVVVGFSDNTALLGALTEQAGWAVLHGPHVRGDHSVELDHVLSCLGYEREPLLPAFANLKIVKGGKQVEGPLCGGCLSMLATSVGTPYAWRMGGRILFIEEVCEYPYRIDRMLHQLLNSSALDGVLAVVFGDLSTFLPENCPKEDLDVLLEEFAAKVDVPVLSGLSAGHVKNNRPLPFGPLARLVPNVGELSYLEPLVR